MVPSLGVAKVEEFSPLYHSYAIFCCMDSEANFRKVRMEASQNDLRLVKVNQPMEKETHLMDLGRGHVPRRVSFALLNLQ